MFKKMLSSLFSLALVFTITTSVSAKSLEQKLQTSGDVVLMACKYIDDHVVKGALFPGQEPPQTVNYQEKGGWQGTLTLFNWTGSPWGDMIYYTAHYEGEVCQN
ncbi:hypothetical protein [Brevibacillus fortis]|uniref:hypothetical protein n=1 Tax=Brevibacillus fortis TaxID=2126352 RepID=UPI0038FD26D3